MATINDVVKDYDTVMSSFEYLNKAFPHWNGPKKDLTLESNLIYLASKRISNVKFIPIYNC
ncbi:MAG: hypothetical protein ACI86M_002605 [Saprospiraceae bacterium]|jgi:hypothetical protein